MCKKFVIIASVIAAIIVATGIAVLTWWLVAGRYSFSTIKLEGDGLGDAEFTAAFTRIRGAGDLFWQFYPTAATNPTSRPIILWLDGVTGLPPSLFANFMMFGPYDTNLNVRSDSWINSYNLLFADAPIGTGFSTAQGSIPTDLDGNAEHLHKMLQSFYSLHGSYSDTPLYIFGQGDGAQLALALAVKLSESRNISPNVKGVVIGNGIVSPAVALTKLGFYLEELAYIDGTGRIAIEQLSADVNDLVNEGKYEDAFDQFIYLGEYVNEQGGAIAVNLKHIIDKLHRGYALRDYFGHSAYLLDAFSSVNDAHKFMNDVVAPGIGVPSDVVYDDGRDDALQAFRSFLMTPATNKVEQLLRDTDIPVTFYNGNLDAVSNTPGQLEWINELTWTGSTEFLNAPRNTLVVNSLVEGYFRETERMQFYWMNAAGQAVPLESPVAMRRILDRITSN